MSQNDEQPQPRVAYEVEGPDGETRIIDDVDELDDEMFKFAFPARPRP